MNVLTSETPCIQLKLLATCMSRYVYLGIVLKKSNTNISNRNVDPQSRTFEFDLVINRKQLRPRTDRKCQQQVRISRFDSSWMQLAYLGALKNPSFFYYYLICWNSLLICLKNCFVLYQPWFHVHSISEDHVRCFATNIYR